MVFIIILQKAWHAWNFIHESLDICPFKRIFVVTGNKDYWNAVKQFLTYKGFLHTDDIAINFGNRNKTNDKELQILPVLPLLR